MLCFIIANNVIILVWFILRNTQAENGYIRFEVLTAVVMKSSLFWDKMLCRLLKINLYFGGSSACCLLHVGFLPGLFFDLKCRGNMFL
jgi:hypothetical protein